jgi:hypothetical protein
MAIDNAIEDVDGRLLERREQLLAWRGMAWHGMAWRGHACTGMEHRVRK